MGDVKRMTDELLSSLVAWLAVRLDVGGRRRLALVEEEVLRARASEAVASGALQEIARGKTAADDEHPLGASHAMAARFISIACAALKKARS